MKFPVSLGAFASFACAVVLASAKDSGSNELGLSERWMKEVIDASRDEAALSSSDLPEGSRQILVVDQHVLFTTGYQPEKGKPTESATVILLSGKASPSSDQTLKAAYVTVVADGKTLRRPTYSRAAGLIRMEVHARNLPTLLRQLELPKVYCWIGHFAREHIYADVHATK